jgi:hypothetical protein
MSWKVNINVENPTKIYANNFLNKTKKTSVNRVFKKL